MTKREKDIYKLNKINDELRIIEILQSAFNLYCEYRLILKKYRINDFPSDYGDFNKYNNIFKFGE